MNLQSLEFILFLLICLPVVLHLGRKNQSAAGWVFLFACAIFYGIGPSIVILAISTGIVYLCIGWMKARNVKHCKGILLFGIVCQLGPLLWFNYAGFFSGGRIIAGSPPLGLSFFVFQQIWLLKEVYCGQWTRSIGLKELFTVNFFFPTVTSGPILRPSALLPQLKSKTTFQVNQADIKAGLFSIGCGTCKKVLLANSFATVVSNGMAQADTLGIGGAIWVLIGCTLRLYFDFSGYCDIAVGTARLFGFRLPENFHSPLRATSLTDFWSRWHITLTTFLRECLYIPLGGNRKGKWRTYLNLMLVFLLSGLWHGAAWTFLFWGGLHGLGMVAERFSDGRITPPKPLGWLITFLFVSIAFGYFFAPDLATGNHLVAGLLRVEGDWGQIATLFEGVFPSEIKSLDTLLPQWTVAIRLAVGGILYVCGLAVALWPYNVTYTMERVKPFHALIIGLLTAFSILSFTTVVDFVYANF